MKTAIVIIGIDYRGGTHKQVLRLCEYMKNEQQDFLLYTVYYDSEKTYPEFQNLDINYLIEGRNADTNQPKIFRLFSKIKESIELYNMIPKDVDIINVHDAGLQMFTFYALLHRKKIIWQINDLPRCFLVGVAENVHDNTRYKLERLLYRWIARRVRRITVNVTKNKDRVLKHMGTDADVFYCGVDCNKSLAIHSEYDTRKPFRILTVGVFFPYRNYETLLILVRRFVDNQIEIRLDIIGDQETDTIYAEKIRKQILDYHLEEYVFLHGMVNEQRYTELFDEASAFCFINVNQSWGLSVFEAMSCGLPTIVSNSVGAVELLHNDEDSIIVDPFDVDSLYQEIHSLMSDKFRYKKLAENGRLAVSNYTWNKLYCEKMVNAFREYC